MSTGWGIIGSGQISNDKMAPAIAEAKGSHLVALFSRSEEKAKTFIQKHKLKRYYTNFEKFLADQEIQAVYVATPPSLHCQQTIRAAEQGKHVFCEKPMAMTISECQKMIQTCQNNKVKLMIGFNLRFNSCFLKAKELIEEGKIGKIVLARVQGSFFFPPDLSWRQNSSLAGGGPLMDMGIHSIDLLRFLLGETEEVAAFIGNTVFDYDVEDTSVVALRFSSGAYAMMDSCYSAYHTENVFEIYGSKGTICRAKTDVQESTGKLKAYIEGKWQEYSPSMQNIYTAEVEHFTECIEQNRNPDADGKEGLRALQIALAAYESSLTKKIIKV